MEPGRVQALMEPEKLLENGEAEKDVALVTFPRIVREPVHEDLRNETNKNDNGCVFAEGQSLLWTDPSIRDCRNAMGAKRAMMIASNDAAATITTSTKTTSPSRTESKRRSHEQTTRKTASTDSLPGSKMGLRSPSPLVTNRNGSIPKHSAYARSSDDEDGERAWNDEQEEEETQGESGEQEQEEEGEEAMSSVSETERLPADYGVEERNHKSDLPGGGSVVSNHTNKNPKDARSRGLSRSGLSRKDRSAMEQGEEQELDVGVASDDGGQWRW